MAPAIVLAATAAFGSRTSSITFAALGAPVAITATAAFGSRTSSITLAAFGAPVAITATAAFGGRTSPITFAAFGAPVAITATAAFGGRTSPITFAGLGAPVAITATAAFGGRAPPITFTATAAFGSTLAIPISAAFLPAIAVAAPAALAILLAVSSTALLTLVLARPAASPGRPFAIGTAALALRTGAVVPRPPAATLAIPALATSALTIPTPFALTGGLAVALRSFRRVSDRSVGGRNFLSFLRDGTTGEDQDGTQCDHLHGCLSSRENVSDLGMNTLDLKLILQRDDYVASDFRKVPTESCSRTMASTQRILIVEDDPKLGAQLRDSLGEAGFEVRWVDRGDDAMRERGVDYDLVILDLMLPGAYGLDVLKNLRAESDLPVLILSARTETFDKVRALELGADDFVTKPFWPEELLARVQARLRRPGLQREGALRVGPLEIDLERRALRVGDDPVELTRAEFDLLATLARRPGAAIARSELVDACLDPEREGTERTLDVHVSRLRRKLGEHGKLVATVWGIGYRLMENAQR